MALHVKRISVEKVLKRRPWRDAQAQEEQEATEIERTPTNLQGEVEPTV